MKTRQRRNVSEDRLTITQCNKRSKKTIENERRENSLPIPIDPIMEIFSRLPAKSIGRCRCVSKPWASILSGSDFTELFLTRSLAWPQLLFASEACGELHFFSSPQPQNLDENSAHIVANYHMNFSDVCYSRISRPVHGLVCLMISKGKEQTPLIYNPSTGQSLLLPKVKTRWVGAQVFSLLGYDPIDKQFKLLSMTWSGSIRVDNVHDEHQVLTLGSENHSWRMIKCCTPHFAWDEGICIDGVLYYKASENVSSEDFMFGCFDVRSEKFRVIQVTENSDRWSRTMINYNGKLGLLGSGRSTWVNGISRSIELIVLENSFKHEWSKHTYILPTLWKNMVGNDTPSLWIIGMTQTNEIVLATSCLTVPFYVLYYNIQKKITIRHQIRGMEAFENKRVHIFLNHVENLKLM